MSKKVIIVGGVAGGATAAARLRRLDEDAEIIMFERGKYISFGNCGLPYYIGDVIEDRDMITGSNVDSTKKEKRLDIRVQQEVKKIDKDKKMVHVKNLKTGEHYEENYDVLVISPGSKPIMPDIPGMKTCKNIFTLRTVSDTDDIKAHVDDKKPKHALIVGGGFIGLEMAENLHNRGIKLTIVQSEEQVLTPLDLELASMIHTELVDKDITLLLNDKVGSFEEDCTKVTLESGRVLNADMAIICIGVEPDSIIAKEADLKVNSKGAIIVDEYMKTSDDSIYALGDSVEVVDYINNEPTYIPLAWPAVRQGVAVANNIGGVPDKYQGTLGSFVVRVFDYTAASTGNNEKNLKKNKIDYNVIHAHPMSHAGYYPDATHISMKLLFEPKTGKILGAQVVAKENADKCIDTIATAIKGELTVFDLPDIETCYAPQYGTAKGAVNMIGYYGMNVLRNFVNTIQWHEVDDIIKDGKYVLDVRKKESFKHGELSRYVNIPLPELRDRLDELPRDKTIYVVSQSGGKGYYACRLLMQKGYKCINIDGGISTYMAVKNAEKAVSQKAESSFS